MEFLGQILSNLVTLALFGLALYFIAMHGWRCIRAIVYLATIGRRGYTEPAWLVQRASASVGVVLALSSGFGLQWWLTMGAVPGTLPRVPHLGEFLGHYLPQFTLSLFGTWPWLWYSGTLGTPVWGLRLLLLAGSAIFVVLMLRAIFRSQIAVLDRLGALKAVVINFALGYLGTAMALYWWPAAMGDRPFFSIVMLFLCLCFVGGMVNATGSGEAGSTASSFSRADYGGERHEIGEEAAVAALTKRRRDQEIEDRRDEERRAAERDRTEQAAKWEEEEKARKKKLQDDKERKDREDKEKRADDARKDKKAADDLAWKLKEDLEKAKHEANERRKHEEWKEEQRRKDEEHRRNNPPW